MVNKELMSKFIPSTESVKWMYEHTKIRIPKIILVAMCGVIASVLGVYFTLVTKTVINSADTRDSKTFVYACIGLVAIMIIQIGLNSLTIHWQDRLYADLERDFDRSIFHKMLYSDFSSASRYHSGDILYRINTDVNTLISAILTICTSFISLLAKLFSALIVLMRLAPQFTVVVFPVFVVIAIGTLFIQRHMKQYQKDVSVSSGKLSSFFQEILEKLMIIQALDIGREVENRAEDMMELRWQTIRRRKNVSITMNLGANILGFAGSMITLIWCATQLLHGKMDYGTLTAMTSLVSQLQGPLLSLPRMIPQLVTITACSERLMEVEELEDQEEIIEIDRYQLYEDMDEFQIDNLKFSYIGKSDEVKTVIRGVSSTIKKGGLTVITGPSGVGKSTLLKLLLGLYRADEGSIQLLKKNGESMTVGRSMRRLFSYAPQGNLILSGTIRDNILMSNPHATEEELQQAIYVSNMEDYLAELPMGIDTVLGENGSGLSEGQVQRVSLARAVISGAPILLLDEVTSSLDAVTERIVLERICSLPDRTCIAVTHRPAALELADWELKVSEEDMVLCPLQHN